METGHLPGRTHSSDESSQLFAGGVRGRLGHLAQWTAETPHAASVWVGGLRDRDVGALPLSAPVLRTGPDLSSKWRVQPRIRGLVPEADTAHRDETDDRPFSHAMSWHSLPRSARAGVGDLPITP
jgi:hypothetical protein